MWVRERVSRGSRGYRGSGLWKSSRRLSRVSRAHSGRRRWRRSRVMCVQTDRQVPHMWANSWHLSLTVTAAMCYGLSLSLSLSFPLGVGSPPQSIPGSSRGVVGRLWRCLLARCPSLCDRGPDTGTPDARPSRRRCGSVGRWPSPGARYGSHQWGMTSAYLCHRHALVPGPIPLPTLVTVLAVLWTWSMPHGLLICSQSNCYFTVWWMKLT